MKDAIDKGSKTTAPQAKPGPWLVFVNKVLLTHGHAPLCPCHLQPLSSYDSRAEKLGQRLAGRVKKFPPWRFTEKVCYLPEQTMLLPV